MAHNWNVDGLINNLHYFSKDYGDFMDSLLNECWGLRASKKIEDDKALKALYDIQCGFHIFETESESITEVFNDFFEDIARCGPSCSNHLYYDPYRYLTPFEKNRFDKELIQYKSEQTPAFTKLCECFKQQYAEAAWGGSLTIKNLRTRYRILIQAFK